jgi:multiple sugar transport system substrate-binding protein
VTRLSFWSGYAGPVPTAMEAVVAEFNAANPDIRVEVNFMPWDVFFGKLLPAYGSAGLDPDRPPTTWDEWRDAVVKLTRDHDGDGTPEQYGMALPDHDAIPVWPILLWGHGGDVLEPDGSKSALTRPETVAAVRTWADLLHRKKVSPVGLAGAEAEQLFQIGDAAMTVSGPWLTAGLEGVDYDVAPIPPWPVRQATLGSTTSVALNAKATPEKKQAAHRFLSYWISEQAQESWMKGSGYPSIRVDQNALADNPFVAEFAADARIAQPLMPGVVEFDKLYNDVFEQAIRNIGDGDVTVEDGLAGAATRMDEILSGAP